MRFKTRRLQYSSFCEPQIRLKEVRYWLVLTASLLAAAEYPAWQPIGPWGGAARVVRLDADRPDTLMAVAMRGTAVFRSRDAGRQWQLLTAFPELPNARLDCGLIVRGQWLVGAAPGGLWRSKDEGETWEVIPGTAKLSVYAITAWAKDDRVLAIGTNQGVWLSHDGAASWRRASPASIADLTAIVSVAFDPQRAGILYAGTPHLPWKTADGGRTWRRVHAGMFDDSDIFSIAIDPIAPNRVFASACSGIYSSDNSAAAWRRVQGIPGTNRRTYVVTQSPHNRQLLYAGTSAGMWVSRDGGATWSKRNNYVATSITWHPTAKNRIFISTERHGLLKSEDEGATFVEINEGFLSRSITAIDASAETLYSLTPYEGISARDSQGRWRKLVQQHFDRLYLSGHQLFVRQPETGWQASSDGGNTWNKVSRPASEPERGDWFETAVDPFDPQTLLRAAHSGMTKSTDGGRTWRTVQNDWIRSIVFHPKQRGLCFALRHQRVFWSPDAGENWYWFPAAESPHLAFEKLHIAAERPDELFAISPYRGIYVQQIPKLR